MYNLINIIYEFAIFSNVSFWSKSYGDYAEIKKSSNIHFNITHLQFCYKKSLLRMGTCKRSRSMNKNGHSIILSIQWLHCNCSPWGHQRFIWWKQSIYNSCMKQILMTTNSWRSCTHGWISSQINSVKCETIYSILFVWTNNLWCGRSWIVIITYSFNTYLKDVQATKQTKHLHWHLGRHPCTFYFILC